MSPKGSMKTFASEPVRVKADWPCHSTRMLLLQLRNLAREARLAGRLLGVVVLAAAQQRRGGGDQAGDDGEGERRVEPVAEGSCDQVREEGLPGQRRVGVGRQPGQGFG